MEKNDYIHLFLEDLNQELSEIPKTKRESYIVEITDHLRGYISDQRANGLTEQEIEDKVKEEFLTVQALAKDLIEEENKSKRHPNYVFLLPLLIIPIGIFLFPSHQEILIALMLFFFSYLVLKKRLLWGFAIVRKNPGNIRGRKALSKLGSLYLFLLGCIFLSGEFVSFSNKEIVFTGCILVLVISFYGIVNKRFVK
ncbi:hypothetical protein KO561_18455 [Radiobacillus kanasensis]|uniref:hypothetical protein n=1 Tax=Radiobacillus kanasensis TaxID=2844358 RepID=UPI001E55DAD7|nr:hypothetical protein [Radiobacillus kanasensis]UFT99134.1 hypothetical protein KO561_18455 [Radiobacillus kanasensis]